MLIHSMKSKEQLLMNSLYGKFAMKNEASIIEIFNTSIKKENILLEKMLELHGQTVQDYIKIGSHYLIIRKSLHNYNHEDDNYHGLEVNVAIASAISGGARVWMSLFKNNSNFNLYYSDTDSIVVDAELPSFMIGKELGQYKLEHTLLKAVFLAPKVYALKTNDGEQIIKAKGLTKDAIQNITIADFELLLSKDSSRVFKQSKFYKSLYQGNISVLDTIYTLRTTSNKRQNIYVNGILDHLLF